MTRLSAATIGVFLLTALSPSWAAPACADEAQAAVVVETGGRTIARCVKHETGMTGIDLLNKSGLETVTKDFSGVLGEAVCSIEGVGTAASRCLEGKGHWHYWRLIEGKWRESQIGAGSSIVKAGTAEGWVWQESLDPSPPRTRNPHTACEQAIARHEPQRSTMISSALGALVLAALGGLAIAGIRRRAVS